MNQKTAQQLSTLNTRFYEVSAKSFSNSRSYPWYGFERISRFLTSQNGTISVLDVACGNGRFGRFLTEKKLDVHYTGLDNSNALLSEARKALPLSEFKKVDLMSADFKTLFAGTQFDGVVVLGLMHHIPGILNRERLLEQLSTLLTPSGLLAVSFWQFKSFDRFKKRIVSWKKYNWESNTPIDEKDLEPGDALLDFDLTGQYRYCHSFDDEEIQSLAQGLTLRLEDDFKADGKETYNRYLIWRRT
jgi:tRNA (uracil-5-)-methyltransferase TRM9